MTTSTARRLAWIIVLIYFTLTAVGLSLQAIARTSYLDMDIRILSLMMALVGSWIITGALIISRHPRHPVGWLLCAGLITASFDMFTSGYVAYDTIISAGSLPGVDAALVWLKLVNLGPHGTVAFTLIVLMFPDGKFFSPGWRKVAGVSVASLLLFLPLQAVEPGPADPYFLPARLNPIGVSPSNWVLIRPIMLASFAVLVLCYGAASASMILRLRNSTGEARQQIKWLIFPVVLYAIFHFWFFIGVVRGDEAITRASVALGQLAILGIVIAVAFAIFKYRLYDIDLIINRTIVYSTLTALVLGFYMLIVGGTGLVIQNNVGLAAALITAVLVGTVFQPMRTFLHQAVSRIFPGAPAGVEAEAAAITRQPAVGPTGLPEKTRGASVWLRAVGILWYLAASAAFVIFIASIPGFLRMGSSGLTNFRFSANPLPIVRILSWISVVGAAGTALLSLLLAVLLFRRRRNVNMAVLTSFFLLLYGIIMGGPIEALDMYLPGAALFATNFLIPLFVPFAYFIFIIFPDGRFVPTWTRWPVIGVFLVVPLAVFRANQYSSFLTDLVGTQFLALSILIVLTMVVSWGICFYAQIYRYRRVSSLLERQQLKWAVFGIGIWFTAQMVSSGPWLYSYTLPPGEPLPIWLAAASPVWVVSIAAIPISLTIAVLRYRLFQIDLLIKRSLFYGALTLAVISIYVLVVGGLGTYFQTQGNLVIALLATGLVAVIVQPLRERLQRGVNRLIYGERDDPVEVLSRLGKNLETALPSDQVLPALVETIAQTLKLPFVGISIQGELVAWSGPPVERTAVFPLTFQGEQIGELQAATRKTQETFTQAELRLLRNLARQASAAVRNAQLTSDLQRSRQRIVTAREEERHRLRRDLHDGIGPTMAGLTLKIEAAHELIAESLESKDHKLLEEAMQILTQLKSQTQSAVRDIRYIVHGLRPPSLDALGLAQALQIHFDQVALTSKVDIRMTTEPQPFPRLSAAVEVAAYRIILEAFTNVINHAQARRCHISLRSREGKLHILVSDDGIGASRAEQSPRSPTGVGLSSMRERAEELGGTFEYSSTESGTTVKAEIPIPGKRKKL